MFGFLVADFLKKRVAELREIERVIGYLSGEIRYNHSLLYEACENVSHRTTGIFSEWLMYLKDRLYSEEACDESIAAIWDEGLDYLSNISILNTGDLDTLAPIGQALGYLDIKKQEESIAYEADNIHRILCQRENELAKQMKLAIYLCLAIGLFATILLL